jgi:hypothetical protein
LSVSPTELTDKNLYAYCDNNPISRVDDDGQLWIIKMAIGVAKQWASDIIGNISSGKKGLDILKPTSSIGTYASSAFCELIPGGGALKSLVRSTIDEGFNIAEQIIKGENVDLRQSVKIIAIGTAFDYVENKASDYVGNLI